jgi:hypothetical protein
MERLSITSFPSCLSSLQMSRVSSFVSIGHDDDGAVLLRRKGGCCGKERPAVG